MSEVNPDQDNLIYDVIKEKVRKKRQISATALYMELHVEIDSDYRPTLTASQKIAEVFADLNLVMFEF